MSEDVQEYGVRSEMETVHELTNPDPDPDLLPALRPDLELQEQTAGHLIRAILRAEHSLEATKEKDGVDGLIARAKKDAEQWQAMIQVQKDRVGSWRACVRGWMLRNEVTKLQAPWFSAFISKGRTKKVVLDEARAIEACQSVYPKAVEMRPRLIKAELDVAVDSFPKHFEGLVEEQTGEAALVIRRREG